jgi:hypothetical protein
MSSDNSPSSDRFPALLEQLPKVDANFRALANLQPVDFPGVQEKVQALIGEVSTLARLYSEFKDDSLGRILAHDIGLSFFSVQDILDDIFEKALKLFDSQSFDAYLDELICVRCDEMARTEPGFIDSLREVAGKYCKSSIANIEQVDDDSDVPKELRQMAAQIAIEPFSGEGVKVLMLCSLNISAVIAQRGKF